jgi:hypothetical protein
MARVVCSVTEGARPAEATVEVRDYQGRPEYLPVDSALVVAENGTSYLSVAVIHVDPTKKAALVALPVEADSGANRIWVKLASLTDLTEASARSSPPGRSEPLRPENSSA